MGAAILVGVASAGTIQVAAGVSGDSGLLAILARLATLIAPMMLGVGVMIGGRMIYGLWRNAAPIAHATGDITWTMGLLSVIGFGGLLVFMLLSGLKHDDMPAAVALGSAAFAGALLAHFGLGLRGRRVLD